MEKVAEDLFSRMQQEDPDTEVDLNVMLRRGIAPHGARELIHQLRGLATDEGAVELSTLFGMAELPATLGTIKEIAEHPDVVHIAENKKEAIENLIDPQPKGT
jgi:hypothetical protein